MKFGGIDWDNRHPETLDIEPGSCDWWMQMDKHFGTSPDSPLSHNVRHEKSLVPCKPMDRFPKESIKKIDVWQGSLTNEFHTTVYYNRNSDNKQVIACSCTQELGLD